MPEVREVLTETEERFERARRTVSLALGPALFALVLLWPMPALSTPAHRLAAVLAWVVVWWMGEPVPLPVTALLGPVLSVLLGVAEPGAVFAPFGHPVLFLFIGSFLIAEAMIVHGLNERIALSVLSVPGLMRSGRRLLVAVGLVPLALSMWISDSATTAMMYPIVLGVLAHLRSEEAAGRRSRFETAMLLTISYAALIGGVGTPVGTPPNLIGVGMLAKLAEIRISFLEWMLMGVPTALLLATLMFAYISFAFPAPRLDTTMMGRFVEQTRKTAGPWTRGQKNALAAFLVAVCLWIVPGIVTSVTGPGSPAHRWFEQHVPEGVASLVAGLLLFVLPIDWRRREFTLDWRQASRIDWGTVLLFGGGLSLGGLMFSTGLADVAGRGILAASGVTGLWGLTAVSIAMAIALTEVTSNTASASLLVPLVIALAKSLGVSAGPPAVGVCLGASMAFMLPVSTPSNAIVYGSGRVPITAMIRTGIVLDAISFVVIFTMLRLLYPALGLP